MSKIFSHIFDDRYAFYFDSPYGHTPEGYIKIESFKPEMKPEKVVKHCLVYAEKNNRPDIRDRFISRVSAYLHRDKLSLSQLEDDELIKLYEPKLKGTTVFVLDMQKWEGHIYRPHETNKDKSRVLEWGVMLNMEATIIEKPPIKAKKSSLLEQMLASTASSDNTAESNSQSSKSSGVTSTMNARRGTEPESLDDAANRLESMGKEIETYGYRPKYTDRQLLEKAQTGNVASERYHVRFMEKGYQWQYGSNTQDPSNLTGALGAPLKGATGEGPKYWSTTFDQIEDADTDAKLISEKLGLSHDPSKEYVMAIIDTQQAAPLTGVKSVPATFAKVSEFANRELPDDFPPEFTDKVMNEAHQAQYAALHEDAIKQGMLKNEWDTNTKDFQDYLDTTNLSNEEKKVMRNRMEMQRVVGNNQFYEGNGLTKNVMANSNAQYGAVETLNFERKQTNLQQLKEANALKIVELS